MTRPPTLDSQIGQDGSGQGNVPGLSVFYWSREPRRPSRVATTSYSTGDWLRAKDGELGRSRGPYLRGDWRAVFCDGAGVSGRHLYHALAAEGGH
jgi:hypothetical protein